MFMLELWELASSAQNPVIKKIGNQENSVQFMQEKDEGIEFICVAGSFFHHPPLARELKNKGPQQPALQAPKASIPQTMSQKTMSPN
jgi:hypothetical protein